MLNLYDVWADGPNTAWAVGYLKSQLATLRQGIAVEGREHDG